MEVDFKIKWLGAAVVLFFVGCILGYFLHANTSEKYTFLFGGERVAACIEDASADSDISFDDNPTLDFCYRKIWSQSALDDYNLRRMVFQNQLVADIVILWMVVVITLSGVLLAALQLYTSYQLTNLRQGQGERPVQRERPAEETSSLEVERGRVALKSSVTGLFILLISFAFFYVYIIFVYQITELTKPNTHAARPDTYVEGDSRDQMSLQLSGKKLGGSGEIGNTGSQTPSEVPQQDQQ